MKLDRSVTCAAVVHHKNEPFLRGDFGKGVQPECNDKVCQCPFILSDMFESCQNQHCSLWQSLFVSPRYLETELSSLPWSLLSEMLKQRVEYVTKKPNCHGCSDMPRLIWMAHG